MLEAVTFDFWDTLVHGGARRDARPGRSPRVAGSWRRPAIRADRDVLAAAFDENWTEFETRWEANAGPYTPEPTHRLHLRPDSGSSPMKPLRAALVEAFHEVGETVPLDTGARHRGACLRRSCDAGRAARRSCATSA